MGKFNTILFKAVIIAVVVILGLFTVRFLAGDEDTWLCVDGEWVKHGVPYAPKPETGCGSNKSAAINSFDECIKAGNPAMESYPRQCRTKDGKTFTENIGNELEKTDLIRINNPRPNQIVTSPLTIEGEARGYWFFEGDFPIVLADWDGLIIAEGYATAQDEWMTEDFVEFKAELEFETPKLYDRGTLVLQKDNPSGLPENDDALEVPIKFNSNENSCINYDAENCPDICAVCPPCIACSSISCQTVEFCESIGFSKDWYDNLVK
jgi:hypothetical protein